MKAEGMQEKQAPWCMSFLVFAALVSHSFVLYGNYLTAEALSSLGASSSGWSRVGLGIARSFRDELMRDMENVSIHLLDSLSYISDVQAAMDEAFVLVGNSTEHSVVTSRASLLQEGSVESDPDALVPVIVHAARTAAEQGIASIESALSNFLAAIKPALLQIGQWLVQYGSKVQAFVETFGTTFDRAQSILDQIMSQMHGHGVNKDAMLQQTFALFDVAGDGHVSAQELDDMSKLYAIGALQGITQELVDWYDQDGDRQLTPDEFSSLVDDKRIPDIMALVLRTYSRRLSEIAGRVERAHMRDDISSAVADYFRLVTSKNTSAVTWVADALGNGSLPVEFTADVLAQACLQKDHLEKTTQDNAGALVVGAMYSLHPDRTLQSVDLLSNTSFWVSSGFKLDNQPQCLEAVAGWVTAAKTDSVNIELSVMDKSVYRAMPSVARRLASEGVAAHRHGERTARVAHRTAKFGAATTKHLAHRLLGSDTPSADMVAPSAEAESPSYAMPTLQERALSSGQLAAPATQQFAKWLAANATRNAAMYEAMCFEYTGTSSNALDSIATYIQGVVKQIGSFNSMLRKYGTPAGVKGLEDMVKQFADSGLRELLDAVSSRAEVVARNDMPQVENAVKSATYEASKSVAKDLLHKVEVPLGEALQSPLGKLAAKALKNNQTGHLIGDGLGPYVASALANLSSDRLADMIGHLAEKLIDDVITHAENQSMQAVEDWDTRKKSGDVRLTAMKTERHQNGDPHARMNGQSWLEDPDIVGTNMSSASNVSWYALALQLKQLADIIPLATQTLKFAKTQAAQAEKQISSVFEQFALTGPATFDDIAFYWRVHWTTYYICFVPLTMLLLFYAFWAGGYFGGPGSIKPHSQASQSSSSWIPSLGSPRVYFSGEGLCALCDCCCGVGKALQWHDSYLGLWSLTLLLQLAVLVIFAASTGLCVLAAGKSYIVSGCSEIYMLEDSVNCAGTLQKVEEWLGKSFYIGHPGQSLSDACVEQNLLTCDLLTGKMAASALLTVIGSLLAVIFSMQVVIESALLHEMAKYRRIVSKTA